MKEMDSTQCAYVLTALLCSFAKVVGSQRKNIQEKYNKSGDFYQLIEIAISSLNL